MKRPHQIRSWSWPQRAAQLLARYLRLPRPAETLPDPEDLPAGVVAIDLYDFWHPAGPSAYGWLLLDEKTRDVRGFRPARGVVYGATPSDALALERALQDRPCHSP